MLTCLPIETREELVLHLSPQAQVCVTELGDFFGIPIYDPRARNDNSTLDEVGAAIRGGIDSWECLPLYYGGHDPVAAIYRSPRLEPENKPIWTSTLRSGFFIH